MNEFTKKTIEDLKKALTEKREALRNFRFGIAGSKLKNLKEGRTLHREIARILTEMKTRLNK